MGEAPRVDANDGVRLGAETATAVEYFLAEQAFLEGIGRTIQGAANRVAQKPAKTVGAGKQCVRQDSVDLLEHVASASWFLHRRFR